jgi:hypothetical protein
MNPQQDRFLNDPSRLKSLGFGKSSKQKGSPAKTPRDKSQDGHEHKDEHAQMHAEHGPVKHAHMESHHDMSEHHVSLEHEDGHKRDSVHDSAAEAADHIKAAHEPSEHGEMDSMNEGDSDSMGKSNPAGMGGY